MSKQPDQVLFVSHKEKNCGVHEYGINIFHAIQKSLKYKFLYIECGNGDELISSFFEFAPALIIYNYHPSTMRWLTKEILEQMPVPHIGTIHEVTQQTARIADNQLFDYHIAPDPTLITNNPIVFKTSRLIPVYRNPYPLPEVPTIGSFGFATKGKGFERLVIAVQEEFDRAVIRLHIPFGDFAQADTEALSQRCRDLLRKPKVELEITHEFLSSEQILDFLAQNTLNAFLYDHCEGRGISSTIDYALAVRRPIAITRSEMFRHLLTFASQDLPICLEEDLTQRANLTIWQRAYRKFYLASKRRYYGKKFKDEIPIIWLWRKPQPNLKQIIAQGDAPLEIFRQQWSESDLIADYEKIVHIVLENQKNLITQASLKLGSIEKSLVTNSALDFKPRILFVNYQVSNCGVYQYGKNLFNAISKSSKYHFDCIDISNIEELDKVVLDSNYKAILYNYHPQTLAFLNPYLSRRYDAFNIAVMHEMTQTEADSMPSSFFQYYIMGDPTLILNNPIVFKTGRFLPTYVNTKEIPDIVTVGTFGFGNGIKGYQRLIDTVQAEFDEAIIRLHIPANGIIDANAYAAKQFVSLCQQKIKKPGIKIQASHDFLDDQGMLDFLAGNTINAFLYDYIPQAGISSSPDHAIAVRRPIAITKSIMFRHLHSLYPSITIEDTSLKQIISNGISPFAHLLELWTEDNIIREYEEILDRILSTNQHSKSLATKFNRILDNQARLQYKPIIDQLSAIAPQLIEKKIPEANVQQAFVVDAVEKFAALFNFPRILCIGSFEDTAAYMLKALGYRIHEIDPVVNNLDLNLFFNLPSTFKNSYDIIFSTSVIEHVEDDSLFFRQIVDLLAPNGVAILTCDYNDLHKLGDTIIECDYRFYTQRDLILRILPLLHNCSLIDVPHWYCDQPDFSLAGFNYTFASIVFQKNSQINENTQFRSLNIFNRAKNNFTSDFIFQQEWEKMALSEQVQFFAKNGFLVIPKAIAPEALSQIKQDINSHQLSGTTENIWVSSAIKNLIANKKLIETLHGILGLDIRFFKGAYVNKNPIGISGALPKREALHVDYGIGEEFGDFRNSCACWINVGYYLTDLSIEHAPYWVVPESHRWNHLKPNTNMEYLEDQAYMILAKAGDIILWHSLTVHATSQNVSEQPRSAFFFSYRPAWAQPIGKVSDWPIEFINQFDATTRKLLIGDNLWLSNQNNSSSKNLYAKTSNFLKKFSLYPLIKQ